MLTCKYLLFTKNSKVNLNIKITIASFPKKSTANLPLGKPAATVPHTYIILQEPF